jgi:hypothetical protein
MIDSRSLPRADCRAHLTLLGDPVGTTPRSAGAAFQILCASDG